LLPETSHRKYIVLLQPKLECASARCQPSAEHRPDTRPMWRVRNKTCPPLRRRNQRPLPGSSRLKRSLRSVKPGWNHGVRYEVTSPGLAQHLVYLTGVQFFLRIIFRAYSSRSTDLSFASRWPRFPSDAESLCADNTHDLEISRSIHPEVTESVIRVAYAYSIRLPIPFGENDLCRCLSTILRIF
jgi:hypothetical protein